jgi:hypothetical protein
MRRHGLAEEGMRNRNSEAHHPKGDRADRHDTGEECGAARGRGSDRYGEEVKAAWG